MKVIGVGHLPPGAYPPQVGFARSPSDALQLLLDLKQSMARLRTASLRIPINDPIVSLLRDDGEWQAWLALMQVIEPFYWTEHTSDLVTAAAMTYPLELEQARTFTNIRNGDKARPTYLPKTFAHALCVFHKPCLFVHIDGNISPLSALIWRSGINYKTQEVWLSLRGIGWLPTQSQAIVCWWSDGGAVGQEDLQVDTTYRDERLAFTKWACTAAMFLEQDIVKTSMAPVNRAFARRAAKTDTRPTCHVVTLRHEIEQERQQMLALAGTVEWSHRWMVRGHWRRQFFAKRGGHAPVWIDPYIKGPDDKPFLEPAKTVFAVRR